MFLNGSLTYRLIGVISETEVIYRYVYEYLDMKYLWEMPTFSIMAIAPYSKIKIRLKTELAFCISLKLYSRLYQEFSVIYRKYKKRNNLERFFLSVLFRIGI